MGYSDNAILDQLDSDPQLHDKIFTASNEGFPIIFGGTMGAAPFDAFRYGVTYPNKTKAVILLDISPAGSEYAYVQQKQGLSDKAVKAMQRDSYYSRGQGGNLYRGPFLFFSCHKSQFIFFIYFLIALSRRSCLSSSLIDHSF